MKWIIFIVLNIFIFTQVNAASCDSTDAVKGQNWIKSYGKIERNKNRYFLNTYGSWSSKTERIEILSAERVLKEFDGKEIYAYLFTLDSLSKNLFRLGNEYGTLFSCSFQAFLVFKSKKELEDFLSAKPKPVFIFKK